MATSFNAGYLVRVDSYSRGEWSYMSNTTALYRYDSCVEALDKARELVERAKHEDESINWQSSVQLISFADEGGIQDSITLYDSVTDERVCRFIAMAFDSYVEGF